MSVLPDPPKTSANAKSRDAKLPKDAEQAKSLTKVLEQSEHVKELVAQSAAELSSANTVIRQEIADHGSLPGVENALEKSEAVENKVQEASEKLSIVNQALEGEVKDRVLLDHQFAAAKEQEEVARHAAFHDGLTGLPNRALVNDRLEHGLAQAKRHGGALAVMFMDLDNFKIINDTHGHDAGDKVLITIARRLREITRDDDTVSRLGGDEFLFLLTEIRDKDNIVMIAKKIVKATLEPCKISVDGANLDVSVGASIGIAVFPEDGATAESLVKSADEAMYQAKQRKCGYAFAG